MHRHAGTQVSAVTLGVCHELQGTRAFSAALVTFQQMARLLSQALTALIFSFALPVLCGPTRSQATEPPFSSPLPP